MYGPLQKKMQDLKLGSHKPSVALSSSLIHRAEQANRYVIIGRPLIPQRQNLRTLIVVLPRSWNLEGSVHGRIIEGRRFQFIFPTEEALTNVLRRGPWSFNERMVVLQRWTPNFNPVSLNFIPFWIQIRGIPFHLIDRDIIIAVGHEIGEVIDIDYSLESAVQVNFVRVCINWFNETCGLLTHDTGHCTRNLDEDDDLDGSGDDGDGPSNIQPMVGRGAAVVGPISVPPRDIDREVEYHRFLQARADHLRTGPGSVTLIATEEEDPSEISSRRFLALEDLYSSPQSELTSVHVSDVRVDAADSKKMGEPEDVSTTYGVGFIRCTNNLSPIVLDTVKITKSDGVEALGLENQDEYMEACGKRKRDEEGTS